MVSAEAVDAKNAERHWSAFFGRSAMSFVRTYAMLPMRLFLAVVAILISAVIILMGEPWRQEWDKLDFRGYLIEGRHWNAAGF